MTNFATITKSLLACLTVALLSAVPLNAQDATFRFGASLSLAAPINDAQMAGLCKAGPGLGLFMIAPFGEKNGLQLRGAYTLFLKDEDGSKINAIDASIEYLRYLPSDLYFTIGAGFVNAKWDYFGSENGSGPGLMASFGGRFTYNISAELRYTIAPSIEFIKGEAKINLTWFGLSLGYRF